MTKVYASIELRPFTVPNYVIHKADPIRKLVGFIEAPKSHLSELDADTLSALCDEFRAEVFRKAGKKDAKR
jgi:hypothetical protein